MDSIYLWFPDAVLDGNSVVAMVMRSAGVRLLDRNLAFDNEASTNHHPKHPLVNHEFAVRYSAINH